MNMHTGVTQPFPKRTYAHPLTHIQVQMQCCCLLNVLTHSPTHINIHTYAFFHSHTCKYTLNFHSPEHVYTQKQTLLLPYLLQRNKNCKWRVLKLRHRTPHIQNNDNNDNSIIHSNIFDNENAIVSIARKNIQDSYPFPLLSPWKCGTALNTARGLASQPYGLCFETLSSQMKL